MSTLEKIKKQQQHVARLERHLAMNKIKERKKETRKKIQLGGLVVKAKMADYPSDVILGALLDALEQIQSNPKQESIYQSKGEAAFMGYYKES